MLDALVSGTTDPEVLADLAKGRLRAKLPALREALQGRFDRMHAMWIGSILAHIDFLDEQISGLTEMIAEQIVPFEKAVELLCTIPGVQRRTAETIIAEIGVDMTVFPSAKHLASWAGMCPGNDQSAGKRSLGQDPQGLQVAGLGLEEAALAATRSKGTYLAAQYQRLRPRRGHKKALGAEALDYRRLLAHAVYRRDLQRRRRRLLPAPRTPTRRPSASSPNSNASATRSPCKRPKQRRARHQRSARPTYFPVSFPQPTSSVARGR